MTGPNLGGDSLHPKGSSMPEPRKKLTDKELVDAINRAALALEMAINAALDANLEVTFAINAEDTTSPRYGVSKVRLLPATAIRRIV